jgi:hypothetical protein
MMVDEADDENKDQVRHKLIVNTEIHSEAGMTKAEFLERIKHVQYLRSSNFEWPVFITGPEAFKRIREFYALVNKQQFRLSNSQSNFALDLGDVVITQAKRNHKFFALEVDEAVYNWFANTDIGVIERQIVSWMAAVYAFNHGFIEDLDQFIHPLLLEEIQRILKTYYPSDILPYDSFMEIDSGEDAEEFAGEDPTLMEEDKLALRREERDWKLYRQACLEHAKSEPVELLGDPFSHESFGILLGGELHTRSIAGRVAYMRFDDWTDIVVRDIKQIKALYKQAFGEDHHLTDAEIKTNVESGKTDTLSRAEGSKELFDRWHHEYASDRSQGVGIFSLYDSSPTSGLVYVIQEESTDKHKIGWTGIKISESPDKVVAPRLAACKTYNAGNPILAGWFMASSKKAETALHRHFEDKRINREWFSLSADDVTDILDPVWRKSMGIY